MSALICFILSVISLYLSYNEIDFIFSGGVLGIIGMLLLAFSATLFAFRLTGMNIGVMGVLKLFLQGMIEGLGESQEMKNEEKRRLDAKLHAMRIRSKEIKDLNDYISGKK